MVDPSVAEDAPMRMPAFRRPLPVTFRVLLSLGFLAAHR